jgi:BirA family transcriptional regulator, biotin operon repressor / biotin---[acetyl-CoA-carboxylase] ligase
VTAFVSRLERFGVVSSTNDVVRDWLAAGVPEVCLAAADVQLAGRGRNGRTWLAPAGAGLLLSFGTRPAWIAPERAWRVPAVAALAIAEAAEQVTGLRSGTIGLKWPNDVAVAGDAAPGDASRWADPAEPGPDGGGVRKLGGVLAESAGLGGRDPQLVVGLGLNVDWEERHFPGELAASMTSLRVLAGRPVSRQDLLAAFVERLEARLDSLRGGDANALDGWAGRQLLPGALVRLEGSGEADGERLVVAIDGESGALVVADPAAPGGERRIGAGEAIHVRLAAGLRPDRAPAPPVLVVGRV